MGIELTEDQRRGAEAAGEGPVRLTDPVTGQEYVLLRAEVFDRLRGLMDDGLDMRQVAVLVEQAMREDDANDPALDSYQKYRNSS